MRRLLVTASVIALGFGGIGLANATGNTMKQQNLSGSSTPPAASAETQSQNTTGMTTSQRPTRPAAHKATATRMSRSEIIQAQRKLRTEGLYRGRIDGKFNSQTRIALRHFQQQNHLPLTARLDNRTMGNLMGGGMGQGSSRSLTTHNRTAGQGSSRALTHNRTMGQGSKKLQNVNEPGGQPENTMGQGSGGNEPNATQMTPPNQPTPSTGGTTNQTPNTGSQNNQK